MLIIVKQTYVCHLIIVRSNVIVENVCIEFTRRMGEYIHFVT